MDGSIVRLKAGPHHTHAWLQVYMLMNRDSFGKFQKVGLARGQVQVFAHFQLTDSHPNPLLIDCQLALARPFASLRCTRKC